MSIVYSRKLLSWQNLPSGGSVTCYLNAPSEVLTVVLRTVTFYWGAPSAVVSNSAVVLDLQADNGRPTIVSFDSGTTSSLNPIWQHFDGFWPIQPTPQSIGFIPLFNVVNTSNSAASVDVYLGGWLLIGQPKDEILVNQP